MRDHLVSLIGENGEIGMYRGGPGWVFTSCLGYVALRLLGEEPQAPHMVRLRGWIRGNGGPLQSASWGKIVLSTLGLYEHRGLHPMTPETWLLPGWAPIHPRRFWPYTRQTYLPMAWLYGRGATAEPDELIRALRSELYGEPYEHIDWAAHRSTAAESDDYRPLSPEFRALSVVLRAWERVVPRSLRARALARIEEHIDYEDDVTQGVRIGVVNGVLNTMVQHFREPGGARFQAGLAGVEACLAERPSGIDLQSNNSTQVWDTSFVIQTLAAATQATNEPGTRAALESALKFMDVQQIMQEPPERTRFHRGPSRGGWTLSTREYSWIVSDCTAEALSALFDAERLGFPTLERDRVEAAVHLLLSMQNRDGGWATCERTRAGQWLERLNPSQVFDGIMTDSSHVECTASCLEALATARRYPTSSADAARIERSLRAGRDFLLAAQRADGGFEGSWGICFTYGTWFGIRGLRATGVPTTDRSIRRAADFLRSIQRPDGSWGESPLSCLRRRHVAAEEGKAVMTAWAVLGLTSAGDAGRPSCERGVRFLVERQRPDGGYRWEGHSGAFQRTGPLDYDGYRHYFPVWAMAAWSNAVRAGSGQHEAVRGLILEQH